ncbi:MAG: AAA family ATPase [Pseudomonadales bacterium]|nr:AAA family ATPase [Pseudomonadales bacterium]
MIILIASQKGGVGKSTLAVNLSAFLSSRGDSVCLVDADPKVGTSSQWCSYREEAENPHQVIGIQKTGNIRQTLLDLDSRYPWVICDTAGRDSKEMRSALTVAHSVLVPLKCSQPDIDTLDVMSNIVEEMIVANPNEDLKIRSVLTMGPTNPSIKEDKEAMECLKDYPTLPPYQTIVRDRKAYRDAMSKGLGVVEMANKKAKFEIESLIEELKI